MAHRQFPNPKPAPPETVVCEVMSALSPQIAETARKNERTILRALAERSQVRVAELLGTSETTVSRADKSAMAAFLAAAGLKAVPAERVCLDPRYVESLRVLAGIGLAAPEREQLDWGDQ